MVCSRDRLFVPLPVSCAATRGRRPTQTLRMSPRVTGRRSTLPASRRMKSSSASKGRGSRGRSWRGVSVVPRIREPIHGTAKSTRPSAVLGTSRAWSPGMKARSTTTCTPWLGETRRGGGAAPVASRACWRTASTHTPVALTTARARTRASPPWRRSRTVSAKCAPGVPGEVPGRRPRTSVWLSGRPPARSMVRARVRARRASSNCPSQYWTPPRSPSARMPGRACSVRAAFSRCVAPRPARPASRS